MLARWYLLLGQFSVTFEYRPGAQHANADGMSRQCGQCQRPDFLVSASDSQVADRDVPQALEERPFASSMDMDLLPELLGETWVASTLLDGLTSGGCRSGSYCGIPSGQDVGDGSGVGPVGQCSIVG